MSGEATPSRPPPGLLIRATRPGDAEAVAAMQALPGFRWGTGRLPYPSPDDVRRWIEGKPQANPSLVAAVESEIVGAAGLERFTSRRAHAGSVHMGVHDAWAGRGGASALRCLQHLWTWPTTGSACAGWN